MSRQAYIKILLLLMYLINNHAKSSVTTHAKTYSSYLHLAIVL